VNQQDLLQIVGRLLEHESEAQQDAGARTGRKRRAARDRRRPENSGAEPDMVIARGRYAAGR
jgi:hypothetical protein